MSKEKEGKGKGRRGIMERGEGSPSKCLKNRND